MEEQTGQTDPNGKRFDVTGIIQTEQTILAPDAREAVARALLEDPDIEPTFVGSRQVIGFDEATNRVILDGDEFTTAGEEDNEEDPLRYSLVKEVPGNGEDEIIFDDEEAG